MSGGSHDGLSRYRVLHPLAPTRLGRAYLATAREEANAAGFFVLELLERDSAGDGALRALFLEEAARTLQLEHPNVIRTQEVLADPDACGRVTRWFAGQPLFHVLERVGREVFPLHLHLRVLCEVLSALQYLHELEGGSGARGGVAYRDTSPGRVLITYTGQVKLLGAGFEQTLGEIERRSGHWVSDLAYASPELCLGYPATPSADVYAVGVMLWEALARARRTFADTREACLRLRVSGGEPDVELFRPGVSPRLAQICQRSLAVSPRDRFPSAQELQIELESYLADTETDAQQNAGLGALAAILTQQFAAEHSEMLASIAAAPSGAAAAPAAASPPAPEPEPESGPEPEDPTHARSPEELVAPAAAPPAAALLPPVPETETSGHRAYASSLRPVAPRLSWLGRAVVPLAVVALLLLVARGVQMLLPAQRAMDSTLVRDPSVRGLHPAEAAPVPRSSGASEPSGELRVVVSALGPAPSRPAQADAGATPPPAWLEGASSPELIPSVDVSAPEALPRNSDGPLE